MTAPGGLVVVGLDASRSSRNAAQWAAVEASRRRAELRLVHARSAVGGELLTATVGELHQSHHRLEITVHLDDRHPAMALRAESRSAGLTVVGSWGASSVPGVPLGSVALAVASSNPAPVAVIHPGHHPNTQGCVVLGLDGSATGDDAVTFAFAAAELRCADLVVVHVWRDTDAERAPLPPFAGAGQVRTAEEQQQLSDRLTAWRAGYPRVRMQPVAVCGPPVPTLLSFADRAQLMVIGSHGSGGHRGLLLGSTGQGLLNDSSCPVVVVASPAARGDRFTR